MRKVLFIIFTCFIVIACNENEEMNLLFLKQNLEKGEPHSAIPQQELTKNNQDSLIRLNEVMDSVMKIANDLGLSIRLSREYTAEHLDEVNIDSIKALFSGLATIKGKYTMNIKKQTKDSLIVRQYKRDKKKRGKRLASIKSESNGYIEFNTESMSNGGYSFSCDCELFWMRDNEGNIIRAFSRGTVSRKIHGGVWSNESFIIDTSNPEWIVFLGSVEVHSIDFGIEYFNIFNYTANYFPNFASLSYVTWV